MKLQKMIAPVLAASFLATMAGGAFAATTMKRADTGAPAQHQTQLLTKTSATKPAAAAQTGKTQQKSASSGTASSAPGTALHKKKG
ncbi:hypothetical protein V6L77_23970 [Pannonibacter sp. Pt2-lr]|uniref:Uncharacterized protein n=1 Tax=Pannonibacter anstelovis TaxID=3121537 RepID=A0ABU7ZHY0_9HYPH